MSSNFRDSADYNRRAIGRCACCGKWTAFLFIENGDASVCSISCAEQFGIDWQRPFRAAGKELEGVIVDLQQRRGK